MGALLIWARNLASTHEKPSLQSTCKEIGFAIGWLRPDRHAQPDGNASEVRQPIAGREWILFIKMNDGTDHLSGINRKSLSRLDPIPLSF